MDTEFMLWANERFQERILNKTASLISTLATLPSHPRSLGLGKETPICTCQPPEEKWTCMRSVMGKDCAVNCTISIVHRNRNCI